MNFALALLAYSAILDTNNSVLYIHRSSYYPKAFICLDYERNISHPRWPMDFQPMKADNTSMLNSFKIKVKENYTDVRYKLRFYNLDESFVQSEKWFIPITENNVECQQKIVDSFNMLYFLICLPIILFYALVAKLLPPSFYCKKKEVEELSYYDEVG